MQLINNTKALKTRANKIFKSFNPPHNLLILFLQGEEICLNFVPTLYLHALKLLGFLLIICVIRSLIITGIRMPNLRR